MEPSRKKPNNIDRFSAFQVAYLEAFPNMQRGSAVKALQTEWNSLKGNLATFERRLCELKAMKVKTRAQASLMFMPAPTKETAATRARSPQVELLVVASCSSQLEPEARPEERVLATGMRTHPTAAQDKIRQELELVNGNIGVLDRVSLLTA